MRGEFTETSGDSSCSRMLMLLRFGFGVSNTGRGSDALRARWPCLLSTGVLENC
jgi:hypothetical protein